MQRLRCTAAARRDLFEIYNHGFTQFGQNTADSYARMLAETANMLLDFPMITRPPSNFGKPYGSRKNSLIRPIRISDNQVRSLIAEPNHDAIESQTFH